ADRAVTEAKARLSRLLLDHGHEAELGEDRGHLGQALAPLQAGHARQRLAAPLAAEPLVEEVVEQVFVVRPAEEFRQAAQDLRFAAREQPLRLCREAVHDLRTPATLADRAFASYERLAFEPLHVAPH